MTWTSEGSVGDRLRALRVRDDILQKQEVDPAGTMDAPPTNIPTDQPGGLPAHMNEPEERQLRHHDPTQMANDQTNGNLAAMTGRVGNMGIGGGM